MSLRRRRAIITRLCLRQWRTRARRAMEEKYGEAYRQWWSPEIRLKDMDRFRWDIQVLLPTGNNGNFAYRVD